MINEREASSGERAESSDLLFDYLRSGPNLTEIGSGSACRHAFLQAGHQQWMSWQL